MQGPRLASHASIPDLPSPALKKAVDDDAFFSNESPELPSMRASTSQADSEATLRQKELGPQSRLGKVAKVAWRHASFLGPGLVASPGNWSTDLAAGASYGYAHLFVILMAGLFAILYQILATRLGVVSGRDLAEQCRASLHNRPKHKLLWRWGVLYPLYLLSEIAVIFTDLAELLGSAIAINLLIPAIPLWAGVLLTGLDVFLVLFFFNSYPSETATKSMRVFEAVIGVLVLAVLGCFIALLVAVKPDWGEAFLNFLPNGGFIPNGAAYASVGIIGATVMPHALFLGSKLATIERYSQNDGNYDKYIATAGAVPTSMEARTLSPRARPSTSLHFPYPQTLPSLPLPPSERDESDDPEARPLQKQTKLPSLMLIRHHVRHASVDIALSLFCFALVINASILILAAAAFTSDDTDVAESGNLFSAHALIKERLGVAPSYLFALALLASGQCASVTVTLAGQCVSEGMLHWSVRPWLRRLITRMISMVPSLIVATTVGNNGLDTLLVASQVALSLILPFVVFPLIWFTSNPRLMTVAAPTGDQKAPSTSRTARLFAFLGRPLRKPLPEGVSFATPAVFALIGWAIFVLIILCNVYAMVQLGEGQA